MELGTPIKELKEEVRLHYEPLSKMDEFTLYKISSSINAQEEAPKMKFRKNNGTNNEYNGKRSLGFIRRKSLA